MNECSGLFGLENGEFCGQVGLKILGWTDFLKAEHFKVFKKKYVLCI